MLDGEGGENSKCPHIVNKIEDVYNDTQHLVGQAENDGVPIVIVRNGTDLLHALLCRVY